MVRCSHPVEWLWPRAGQPSCLALSVTQGQRVGRWPGDRQLLFCFARCEWTLSVASWHPCAGRGGFAGPGQLGGSGASGSAGGAGALEVLRDEGDGKQAGLPRSGRGSIFRGGPRTVSEKVTSPAVHDQETGKDAGRVRLQRLSGDCGAKPRKAKHGGICLPFKSLISLLPSLY